MECVYWHWIRKPARRCSDRARSEIDTLNFSIIKAMNLHARALKSFAFQRGIFARWRCHFLWWKCKHEDAARRRNKNAMNFNWTTFYSAYKELKLQLSSSRATFVFGLEKEKLFLWNLRCCLHGLMQSTNLRRHDRLRQFVEFRQTVKITSHTN